MFAYYTMLEVTGKLMANDSDDDDFALFRESMRDVKPIKSGNKISSTPSSDTALRKVSQKLRQKKERDEIFTEEQLTDQFSDTFIDEECPNELSFFRAGLQHSVKKKLRQGKFDIDATLDLHGFTVNEARQELMAFLAECQAAAYHCVIIVHGKGYRSKQKPVIKTMINKWLRVVPEILAFVSAQPGDGGTGAVYVLFRRPNKI